MPNYLLSVYQPGGSRPSPERLATIRADVEAVRSEMQEAGIWVFSGGLDGPEDDAVVQRVQSGRLTRIDGPFVETKEHLGGLTIINVPDRETAVYWGGRTAEATTLPIEVRTFLDMPAEDS